MHFLVRNFKLEKKISHFLKFSPSNLNSKTKLSSLNQISILKSNLSTSFVLKQNISNTKLDSYLIENLKMKTEQITIPVPWGSIKGQVFGDPTIKTSKPVLCFHGHLDNSNSFKPLAPYLTKSNEYHLIALDFPGHGFSSKIPDGIPYKPNFFLSSIRRAVNYLGLKDFYILSHSYGVGLGFMYDLVFPDEVKAIVALDWIFTLPNRVTKTFSQYINEGVEQFLKFEKEFEESKKDPAMKRTLTKDLAVSILLKANNHLDEQSAKILIERALITTEDERIEFSRDIKLKPTTTNIDHFIDFYILLPEFRNNLKTKSLMIHADPPSYGQNAFDITFKFLNEINENSKAKIEFTKFNGTHHFHMINPKETSEIILDYLNKLKEKSYSKL